MKKVLIAAALAAGCAAGSAEAADGFVFQVKCPNTPAFKTLVNNDSAFDAEKIAKAQNPGCQVTNLGRPR